MICASIGYTVRTSCTNSYYSLVWVIVVF